MKKISKVFGAQAVAQLDGAVLATVQGGKNKTPVKTWNYADSSTTTTTTTDVGTVVGTIDINPF